MQERGFDLHQAEHRIRLIGGRLWKAEHREESDSALHLDEEKRTLRVFLHPQEPLDNFRNDLYGLIQQRNWLLHIYFAINKRVPSLLMLLPVSLTVFAMAFIGLYGEFVIEWTFANEDTGTIFGVSRRLGLIISTLLAIFLLYFFPVFVTGEQDGFVQAINQRFSARQLVKRRFRMALNFFTRRGYIEEVEIWNPDFSANDDWVKESLIPALLELNISVTLYTKLDERTTAEHYLAEALGVDSFEWTEQTQFSNEKPTPISYNYLENWEKNLLAVYVFASTANCPQAWQDLAGAETDGVMRNAVSLRLVEAIIEQFKERLFSEDDRKNLISIDAFAARCVNDYGILSPCLRYTNDVWRIDDNIVAKELTRAREQMKYIYSYLQINIENLSERLEDPISALVLNGVHQNVSIHNHDRLEALRFFVRVINSSEQYKILKQYWELVIANPAGDYLSEDVYRILGVDLLNDLATLFERAAMYDHAIKALNYLEMVYPYRGKVGKARIAERQGNYEKSVVSMLEIRNQWKSQQIDLQTFSAIDLNLNIAWAVVSGRLEAHKNTGLETLAEADRLLNADFDKIRNSEQAYRLFNIRANYEEWLGNPEGSLVNYAQALQIPGVAQAALSNLFVNQGIALRQKKQYPQAAQYGEQGCEIKAAIGDADQLPIALHNLAQTYVEWAFTMHPNDRIALFEKANRHAQTGLDIQAQTGSTKKRGQLLTERFIALYQLQRLHAEDTRPTFGHLAEAQQWLQTELEAGRGQTYDCKVVVNELFGLLVEFKNQDIQGVIKTRLS